MNDLGSLNYFLDVTIYWYTCGLFLCQKKYAMKVQKGDVTSYCKHILTFIDTKENLVPMMDNLTPTPLYIATLLECFNILYVVQQICFHMYAAHEPQMVALKCVLHYVQAFNVLLIMVIHFIILFQLWWMMKNDHNTLMMKNNYKYINIHKNKYTHTYIQI